MPLHDLAGLKALSLVPDETTTLSPAAETAPAPVATDETAPAAIAPSKAKIVVRALRVMEDNIKNMIRLLEEDAPVSAIADAAGSLQALPLHTAHSSDVEGRVIEGVFDGVRMIGADGKSYPVPPNYASKSKLVEGDLLKLTIGPRGNFIFKQVGPIERERIVGHVGYDQTIGEYYVAAEDKRWNVIKASVTYFKGDPGDEAVVLVPKDTPAKWAAVENIIRKNPLG